MEQILRLASRRTDAPLVFADGGRRAARRAVGRLNALSRWSASRLPRLLGRALGFRLSRRAAQEVFGATLTRDSGQAVAVVRDPLALRATPDGAACAFFAAGFAELLRQLTDFDGAMAHSRCLSRGADCCEWRATNSPGGTR
jgi:predicted hydrocarbon binding protein